MADASWRFEKQYEIWQQQQTSVSRWAIGTAAFALVVPLLVLSPFDRLTHEIDLFETQLAAINQEQQAAEQQAKELTNLNTALASVATNLEAQPWQNDRDGLIQTMSELSADWRSLAEAKPDDLLAAEQMRRELVPQHPLENSMRQMPPTEGRIDGQIPNLRAPDRYPSGERDLQRPNLRAPDSNIADPRSDDNLPADARRAPEDARRLWDISEALQSLDVDGAALATLPEDEKRRTVVKQLEDRAGEAADRMIETVETRVENSVIAPMRAALQRYPLATQTVPQLAGELEAMQQSLQQWVNKFHGNREWYRTIQGKGEAVDSLAHSIGAFNNTVGDVGESWKNKCQTLITNQQQAVSDAGETLDEKAKAMQARLSTHQEAMTQLGKKLEGVLPSWIGNLVSPMEMVQIFPAVVLILIACIAFQAWKLRRIYHLLESTAAEDGVPINGVADASTWTLSSRGSASTVVTIAAYLGGTVLLWCLFEQGSAIACRFKPDGSESAMQLIQADWQANVQTLGRVVFIIALVLITVVMFRREQKRPSPDPSKPGARPDSVNRS
jgi:hypothetical protein